LERIPERHFHASMTKENRGFQAASFVMSIFISEIHLQNSREDVLYVPEEASIIW
jgi:hypothetical protein